MALTELSGPLNGSAEAGLEAIIERLTGYLDLDPDLSFQMAALRGGRMILDVWGGPHLDADSLMVPFSVSKNTIGLSVGLLIQRGLLDLDAPVAEYWPEFGAAGKAHVSVRQLLSHQAGLPEAQPRLTWDELLDPHAGAQRLAATRPFWRPGSAFGYHAMTMGNLGSELIYRITGDTLSEFYERELRASVGADFYLGLPPEHEARLVPVLKMIPPLAEAVRGRRTAVGEIVLGPRPGAPDDIGNDPRGWRSGHAAFASTASARGIATLLAACVTGLDGTQALLDADTVAVLSEQQVRGYDEVLDQHDRAHGIVFQKPSALFRWGGPRSFGHDGACGAVACVDPDTGVAFAYTIARGPWPGGGDPRAIAVAGELAELTR